jgi:hypothetical protein
MVNYDAQKRTITVGNICRAIMSHVTHVHEPNVKLPNKKAQARVRSTGGWELEDINVAGAWRSIYSAPYKYPEGIEPYCLVILVNDFSQVRPGNPTVGLS